MLLFPKHKYLNYQNEKIIQEINSVVQKFNLAEYLYFIFPKADFLHWMFLHKAIELALVNLFQIVYFQTEFLTTLVKLM
jgi:hypothetical protein